MSTMDDVGQTLKDQTILVTGATGFMGKVLLEKLLRSVQPKHIYVLVRPRKGQTPHQRMEAILSSPIFAKLKSTSKDINNQITIIDSDLSVAGLGLSPQDAGILKSQVNVVFHIAAVVRFDDPLKDAYNINVRGTKELLTLAKEMDYLKAFLHVSTAYSHCNQSSRIEEKLYDMPIPYEKLENILDSLDVSIIDYMTPKLLGNWPNTYCFTKALAENVVKDFSEDIPIAVVRPGIVVSCVSEPLPGWVDNVNGAHGLVLGAYTGVIHVSLCDSKKQANLVPCDLADNLVIAAAAKLVHSGKEREVKVYNFVSQENPITFDDQKQMLEKYGYGLISAKSMWVYFLIMTKSKYLYFLLSLFLHYLPALLVDVFAFITGIKLPIRSFCKLYMRIDKAALIMHNFTMKNWDWETTNVHQLWADLSKTDKELFRFDINTLNWDDVLKNMILGTRLYLLNDDISTLQKALSRYKMLYIIHLSIKIVLGFILLKIVFSLPFISDSIYYLLGIQ